MRALLLCLLALALCNCTVRNAMRSNGRFDSHPWLYRPWTVEGKLREQRKLLERHHETQARLDREFDFTMQGGP